MTVCNPEATTGPQWASGCTCCRYWVTQLSWHSWCSLACCGRWPMLPATLRCKVSPLATNEKYNRQARPTSHTLTVTADYCTGPPHRRLILLTRVTGRRVTADSVPLLNVASADGLILTRAVRLTLPDFSERRASRQQSEPGHTHSPLHLHTVIMACGHRSRTECQSKRAEAG